METKTKLSADRLDSVFRDCLFREDEDHSDSVPAPGIQCPVGFHPGRLASHRGEISEMLAELPDQFRRSGGGGWSFLNACVDRSGEQWTGLHQRMEQLFQLGEATGLVKCLLPREAWSVLPGGLPYYSVDL